MEKLRYNRVFKKGIVALLFCLLLFGSVIAFFIVAKVQYDELTSGMESLEATIVDIRHVSHTKGPSEQEIHIEYTVDGITYSRELETDTVISFAAGRGAHYSVGDKVQIYYDPDDPEIIASPRSIRVGYYWLALGVIFFGLAVWALCWVLEHREKFLVTEEEYAEEGEEIKEARLDRRQEKKEKRLERRQERKNRRQNFREKHPLVAKLVRVLMITIAVLVALFILYMLFGIFLLSIGY
ncbi:MAG: DUF3592 domain-containing protein [Clostridia bacterium]|nr:DUF3592 domain-containing protein [Clostridia bacterium]